MKQECSIVRDLLPLYAEEMTEAETAAFVKNHLQQCPDCASALESLKKEMPEQNKQTSAPEPEMPQLEAALKALRRRFRKKLLRALSLLAAILVTLAVLLHFFPVYRLVRLSGTHSYYTAKELAMVISIGSKADRAEAQAVLRQADAAFQEHRHTREENQQTYGLLSRYASHSDSYPDVAFVNHSLELWSAHLGENEGYLWVYYSCEAFDHAGNRVHGSANVESLWRVEKDAEGQWKVVQIREHP